MATIVHQKIKLAFEERGVGRPAFVFVHGWSCDRSFFAPQVEHFSRQHRVVAVDLRGHGESDKPQGVYRISDYADDTASILDQLRFGKVVASATAVVRGQSCNSPPCIPSSWRRS
jgi:pimeloyl-ACP methyl ester carboxylesterase